MQNTGRIQTKLYTYRLKKKTGTYFYTTDETDFRRTVDCYIEEGYEISELFLEYRKNVIGAHRATKYMPYNWNKLIETGEKEQQEGKVKNRWREFVLEHQNDIVSLVDENGSVYSMPFPEAYNHLKEICKKDEIHVLYTQINDSLYCIFGYFNHKGFFRQCPQPFGVDGWLYLHRTALSRLYVDTFEMDKRPYKLGLINKGNVIYHEGCENSVEVEI